ncbi:MAG: winged helix-turn-helix domain-containing protein [Candidatus Ranarchaeia archaeon]
MSHRSRRSKAQMVVEVLEACTYKPQTQTSLLRTAGLTTESIKRILEFLLQGKLIELQADPIMDNNKYQITPKGTKALTQYYDLMTIYFKGLEP